MHRKLTLNVDALTVNSFEAGGAPKGRGTVEAQEKARCTWSAVLNSCPGTVHTCITYDFSCRADA